MIKKRKKKNSDIINDTDLSFENKWKDQKKTDRQTDRKKMIINHLVFVEKNFPQNLSIFFDDLIFVSIMVMMVMMMMILDNDMANDFFCSSTIQLKEFVN